MQCTKASTCTASFLIGVCLLLVWLEYRSQGGSAKTKLRGRVSYMTLLFRSLGFSRVFWYLEAKHFNSVVAETALYAVRG